MKKLLPSLMAIVALGVSTAGLAADSACKLSGGWIGYLGNNAGWTALADGISQDHGTITIAYPALDPTLSGMFDGVRVSTFSGVWERTGGRSFAYTTIAIAVNAAGETLWIAKLEGTETLQAGCGVELVTAMFYAYPPNANPFEDTPLMAIPLPDHYGYRMAPPAP